jgi:hypothetical protein
MSTLQRLAALADTTAKLIVQLRELNELREQVRKAELAQRSLRLESRSQPTPRPSGNRRSVSLKLRRQPETGTRQGQRLGICGRSLYRDAQLPVGLCADRFGGVTTVVVGCTKNL